jgi:hypothetical protein
VADIHADINALKAFHESLARFRYVQRDVADCGDHEIKVTCASLEAKASRWRSMLEQRRAELDACGYRAAQAARDGGYVDCSAYVRAVHEAQERLEHIRRWQQRVEQEAAAFRGIANRFRNLIETEIPRADAHLQAIIKGLESARHVRASDS